LGQRFGYLGAMAELKWGLLLNAHQKFVKRRCELKRGAQLYLGQ